MKCDALSAAVLTALLVASAFLVLDEPRAHAQQTEDTTYAPPASLVMKSAGESTYFLADGGCACVPLARIPVAPFPCNGTCALQRARTRNAVADAIDGGALAP
jgi:hypothetical protein